MSRPAALPETPELFRGSDRHAKAWAGFLHGLSGYATEGGKRLNYFFEPLGAGGSHSLVQDP